MTQSAEEHSEQSFPKRQLLIAAQVLLFKALLYWCSSEMHVLPTFAQHENESPDMQELANTMHYFCNTVPKL